jgi:outer membrane protein OmpA-like peptidoglycan-associated protein
MKRATTLLLFLMTTLGWGQTDTNFFDFKEGVYLDLYSDQKKQPLFIEDLSSLNFINADEINLNQMIAEQQKMLLLMMAKLDSIQLPVERIAALEKEVAELKAMVTMLNQSQNLNSVASSEELIYMPTTTFDVPADIAIYFKNKDYSINSESLMILNEVIDILTRNPKWKVIINGYAHDENSAAANLELARNRSLEVQRMLLSAGVDPLQLVLRFPQNNNTSTTPKAVLSFIQL